MAKQIAYGEEARKSLMKVLTSLLIQLKSHSVLRAEMLYLTKSTALRSSQTTV